MTYGTTQGRSGSTFLYFYVSTFFRLPPSGRPPSLLTGLPDRLAGFLDPLAGLPDTLAGLPDPKAGLPDPLAGLPDTLWLASQTL